MNIKSFEEKYKEKGGLKKLAELRSLFTPQKTIARHFGVSQERVRQWMLQFFGTSYDPREDRRKVAMESMIEFYHQNSMEEFRSAFRGTAYYKDVLKIIKNTIV